MQGVAAVEGDAHYLGRATDADRDGRPQDQYPHRQEIYLDTGPQMNIIFGVSERVPVRTNTVNPSRAVRTARLRMLLERRKQ